MLTVKTHQPKLDKGTDSLLELEASLSDFAQFTVNTDMHCAVQITFPQ
jgi:hypothetical protein